MAHTCGNNSRTKLDKRSITCILSGVSEESKAYKLYNPVTRQIIINRGAVFEDDE